MNPVTRTRTCVPAAAMILAAALTVPAAAQQQVLFEGVFQGSDTVSPPTITTTAAGVGTHLGRLSFTNVLALASLTGTGHWVAANRDQLETTFVVVSAVPGPVVFKVTEIHTIAGGTGRFARAQGSFIVDRTHVVEPGADGTHLVFGSFHGTITPPGAVH
jgi:hypothetical protein